MLTMEHPQPDPVEAPRWGDDLGGRLFDGLAVLAVAILAALGACNLAAVDTPTRALRQFLVVLAGLGGLVALRRLRVTLVAALGWACYGLSVALLAFVVVAGPETGGVTRWLDVGWFTIQPSELAKLGLLFVLAHVLAVDALSVRRFVVGLVLAAVPIGLTVLQPDLSTALLLGATTVAMLVVGRAPGRFLLPLVAAVVVALPLALPLLHDYQLARLQGFFSGNPSTPAGYTVHQAHIAVAAGGLTGRFGEPFADLLADYLPENETDLAFASLVEQFGLAAGACAVVASLVLLWRLVLASREPRTHASRLLTAGLAALFGMQVVVSVGGNLGLVPLAGIPFPLLSFGGSAAVVLLAALGLVLGARRDGVRRRLWAPPLFARPGPRATRKVALTLTALLFGCSAYGWHVQDARGRVLRLAAEFQMTRCVALPAPRGLITDRHGTPLVVNVTQHEVVGVAPMLRSAPQPLARLAELTGRAQPDLEHALADATGLFVPLGAVAPEAVQRITAERLAGVFVIPTYRRVYPYGPLLGPLLGFAGADTPDDHRRAPDLRLGEVVGRAGIERHYDAVLRGVDGRQCVYVDPSGRPVALGPRRDPVPGNELRLAIDLGLQQEFTAALAAARESSGGDLAGAVAMDPRNGQVLALASVPAYDNNLYGPPVDQAALTRAWRAPGYPLLEHASQVAAPPGSIFKLVVAAADTVHQALPPDVRIPTGGAFTYGGHRFGNWRTFGPQNLVEAIAWSNDVYFYKLAVELGATRIRDMAAALGVGRPTGIDLPGESPGYLGDPQARGPNAAPWYPGSTVILGIGQGPIEVTPLQAVRWTGAIATGRLVTPRLGLAFGSGDLVRLPAPAPAPLPFAAALGPVRDGMRQVVESGTARLLSSLPVPVLAKTGTAEDATNPARRNNSWLVAAAPADDPVIAVVSFVRGGGGGSAASGPVVLRTLRYFFEHQAAISSRS